jgi:GNAT superfamily N-acetyltransferase
MILSKLWENYFLKKRYLMSYSRDPGVTDTVVCIPMPCLDVDSFLPRADERLKRYLKMRRDDPAWMFFYYQEGKDLAGYSFLHSPCNEEWNDSLPTYPGEGRISSNYVYPEHRGKGVRGEIYKRQFQYANNRKLKLWCVIEKSNASSIRAESKHGSASHTNYLVKFMGRNLASILTNPFRVYLLFGIKRSRI